jgi:hypothetical protein
MTPTEPDLWIPSDDLLARDPIAVEHVHNPHPRVDMANVVALPDVVDDRANDAAAAAVLAELEDDDQGGGEEGRRADDGDIDPDDDGLPVDPDV